MLSVAHCCCGGVSGSCCWFQCATVCADACYGLGTITDDQGSHDLSVVPPGTIGFGGVYASGTIHEPGAGPFAQYRWFIGCGADSGKVSFYVVGTSFSVPFNGPYEATPSDCDPLTATVTLPTGQIWSSFLTFGTVSLPLLSPPLPDDVCCFPCPLPKADLTITINGGMPHTMVYHGEVSPGIFTWSYGSYSLSCGGGGLVTLAGVDTDNVLDPGWTCDPLHLQFEGLSGPIGEEVPTGNIIIIDE